MKHTVTILLYFVCRLCMANMASPIREGTFSSSAFCSRDIDILKEIIHITLDKDFKTAAFVIEYYIRSDVEGRQIPLLFHAQDYLGDFKVWVNNQKALVLDVPSGYKTIPSAPFEKFSDSFNSSTNEEGETVTIYWEKGSGFIYNINELKYFDIDLGRGESIIRVEYTASAWSDISKWVTEYSFRYSLSPAKHWKSFGSLEIIVDGSAFASPLTSSLGQPSSVLPGSVSVWKFSNLPADYFEIIYAPKINALAKVLITLEPIGLTIIFSLVLTMLHYWGIKKYRRSKPTKKYSWVVIAGSVVLPFVMLIGYMVAFEIIDTAIGSVAGGYHGYTFLVIIFYPLLLPVYWIIMWLIDRRIKKNLIGPLINTP